MLLRGLRAGGAPARRLLLLLLLVLLPCLLPPAAAAQAAVPPHHDLVRVAAPGEILAALVADGFDVVGGKVGIEAQLVATPADQARLRAADYDFEVTQPDLERFYAARNGKGIGFGAFHTYSETVAQLDALHAAYPTLTTAKYAIGTTGEGRTIWAFKVSDNPDTEEDEPEVLFDGLHHAREPMATETCLLLIEYLCAHYDTDARVRWLVDEREIFFVPIVNPDGYVYNETIQPNGGGMWRKNRRNSGGGDYGVDPNRNYPYEWEGEGSSDEPAADTYRGPAPGSEPETQAMMNLALAHQFQTAQSFHTYSNLTLFPWGYATDPAPDSAVFRDIAAVLTAHNGYVAGQPGAVLYVVNGGSFDWQYGEQALKGKIFAFSNEIGGPGDGFWPHYSRIPQLFQDNLEPALHLIEIAGPSVFMRGQAVAGGDGNGRLDPGESAGLAFDIQNGAVMMDINGVAVSLLSDDPYLQLGEAGRVIGRLGPRAVWSAGASPFPLTVDPACPSGHVIRLTARVAWNGGTKDVPVTLAVGPPTVLLSDNLEGGTGLWTLQSPWALSTAQCYSATHSLTDSPSGLYANLRNVSAQLATPLNLATVALPTVSFWTRYATEQNCDFGFVETSTDGALWQTLAVCSGTRNTWLQQSALLDGGEGNAQLRLRFRFQSDSGVTNDGWYVDDIVVSGYPAPANAAPSAPLALAPVGGTTVGEPVTLTVQNAADTDGPGALAYGFRVYADPGFAQPVATQAGVVEGSGQTSWTLPAGALDGLVEAGQPCYWRAWADDTAQRGPLSAGAAFVYDPATGVPDGARRAYLSAAPAGGGTAFRFALPRAGRATLALYNLRGERVATAFRGEVASEGSALWDQRDRHGARVASGLYLARLSGPGTELSLKVLILR